MLSSLGHRVNLYGARSIEEEPLEKHIQSDNFHFIETHTTKDIFKDYSDGDNRHLDLGYDWHRSDFRHDINAQRKPSTLKYYAACVEHINKIKKADDFLLITQGYYQKPIADAVKLYLTCEPGIGYRGSYTRFRAFESSYIQNFTYGSANPFKSINGNYYDRVIPNYFDPDDFEFSDEKDDYYLYIGRIISRKGIATAAKACDAIEKKLIIVGQAARVNGNGLESITEPGFRIPPGTWEYRGFAPIEKRKKLMSRAIATFVPTEYLEPFAGTHIESMLSGTPAITTNFGVFPETIPEYLNGKIGERCNTLADFVRAAKALKHADHAFIREYAERFLMDNVKYEFEQWFVDLHNLWESSIDSTKKGWHRL